MEHTIMRRDATLPEAHAPGLLRDRCTSCKGDSLLRIRSQSEHEVRAECTWCGAPQRRISKPNTNWTANFATNRTTDQRLSIALQVFELREQGVPAQQIANQLSIKRGSVWYLMQIARKHHGLESKSRKLIRQQRFDMLVLYTVFVDGLGWSESQLARYAGIQRQTIANIRVKLHPESRLPKIEREWQRAVQQRLVIEMLIENPEVRSPVVAKRLGIPQSTAVRRLQAGRATIRQEQLDVVAA